MLTCKLCGTENLNSNEVYHCNDNGYKFYECVNEKKCRSLQSAFREKKEKEEQLKKEQRKNFIQKEHNTYQNLSKQEYFNKKYGLSFDNLDKSFIQYRDNSDRYELNGIIYRWDRFNKIWEITKD